MPYCQRCDKKLDTGAYCPDCGSELVQPETRVGSPPEEAATVRSGDTSDGWEESDPDTAVERDREEGEDYYERGPLSFSLTYPVADGWEQVLISAGLLFLGSFLFFPVLFVYGYAYRLGRAVIRGDHRPPTYGDWGGLLKDGVLLFVVSLPFVLVPLAIVSLLFLLGGAVDRPLLGAVSVPLYVAGLYVSGGVLPTFMATGSVTETYSGFRFLEFVRTVDYLKALLLGVLTVLVATAGLLLVALVLVFTIVGVLFAIPLLLVAQPIVMFVPFVLFGYYYRNAMQAGKVSELENDSTLGSRL